LRLACLFYPAIQDLLGRFDRCFSINRFRHDLRIQDRKKYRQSIVLRLTLRLSKTTQLEQRWIRLHRSNQGTTDNAAIEQG
jgi:hypothetical protein